MNSAAQLGLILSAGLVAFGLVTFVFQYRGLARLRATKIFPSDERTYYRRRYLRRIITGFLIATIGGMIAGAYLSGMEGRADALGEGGGQVAPEDKKPMDEGDKRFVRFWGGYWIAVVVQVFLVMVLALVDVLATRRFALQQYQTIREDHETKLRRDLALYVQQKQVSRGGRFGNRLGES